MLFHCMHVIFPSSGEGGESGEAEGGSAEKVQGQKCNDGMRRDIVMTLEKQVEKCDDVALS